MAFHVFFNDQASKEHEVKFFQRFASNLAARFKYHDKDEEAFLIGFPKVPSYPDVKPDCILITKHRIVIIDFKAYGDRKNDKLVFENNNFRGKWYIDGPLRNKLFFVQAGAESKNRTNPYDQVKEYSKGLLERVFPQNDEYDFTEKRLLPLLSSCVLFTYNLELPQVPAFYNGFSLSQMKPPTYPSCSQKSKFKPGNFLLMKCGHSGIILMPSPTKN